MGDVFWFTVPTGRRALFRCVAVSGDDLDSYPTVEVLDWPSSDAPPDPAAVPALSGKPHEYGRWPDLLALVRYPRDPDPATRIDIVARGTNVNRGRTLPALMVPWTALEEDLDRFFGR